MLYNTKFATTLVGLHTDIINTGTDLGLIPQSVVVSPATPKLNLVDIPGGNGSVDLTEITAGLIPYNDRTIKWVFTLYPGVDWATKRSEVSNALNGKRLKIVLGDDPDWYYDGRISVKEYKSDKLFHQITVEATCAPYKLKAVGMIATAALTTDYTEITCNIGLMPQVPKITVDTATMIQCGNFGTQVSAGTYTFPELFVKGTQIIKAKAVRNAEGTITVSWKEGSL